MAIVKWSSLIELTLQMFCEVYPWCLYYKPITIVKDASSVVIKLATSLIDDARVIIYDRHMFIVQATGRAVT